MRKKIFLIIVTMLLVSSSVLTMVACDRIDNLTSRLSNVFFDEALADSAVDTVENFFDSIIEKDYETAYKYVGKTKDKTYDDFIDEFKDVTDIVTVEINWVEVKNNLAEVGIDIMDSYDGDEKIYKDLVISLLREEESDWEIVFWD